MPENCAITLFKESLTSLMAHTIRALFNHYYKKGIAIDVIIIADTANSILPLSPTANATTMLRTHLTPASSPREKARVTAWIYIHKDASRHLARFCIAHEIYHLVLELEAYIKGGRVNWSQIPVDPSIEDKCNVFARRICGFHDKFNKDPDLREQYINFPERIITEVVRTASTEDQPQWPNGVSLDPDHPFHKTVPPSWLPEGS